MKPNKPILKLNSGLSLSVQASKYHYCSPRNDKGPYHSVEIGFPSKKVDKLLIYAEDIDNPTKTVYGYVPVYLLIEIINDNGGIDYEAMGVTDLNKFLN